MWVIVFHKVSLFLKFVPFVAAVFTSITLHPELKLEIFLSWVQFVSLLAQSIQQKFFIYTLAVLH